MGVKQKAEIYVKQTLGVASTDRFISIKKAYIDGYAESKLANESLKRQLDTAVSQYDELQKLLNLAVDTLHDIANDDDEGHTHEQQRESDIRWAEQALHFLKRAKDRMPEVGEEKPKWIDEPSREQLQKHNDLFVDKKIMYEKFSKRDAEQTHTIIQLRDALKDLPVKYIKDRLQSYSANSHMDSVSERVYEQFLDWIKKHEKTILKYTV